MLTDDGNVKGIGGKLGEGAEDVENRHVATPERRVGEPWVGRWRHQPGKLGGVADPARRRPEPLFTVRSLVWIVPVLGLFAFFIGTLAWNMEQDVRGAEAPSQWYFVGLWAGILALSSSLMVLAYQVTKRTLRTPRG